jgi:NAD(P)-dependent dehydrogenase (short-subunit alcohol dehydrogenase family)
MTNNSPHTPARTVAITGGARGIGYQTAKELIRRGHRVAIGDIDEARAKEAAAELGVKVVTRLDVTEPDSFTTFLDLVERELGPLDILINNAGIMPTGHAHEEDDAVTRRQVEINVLGVIFGTKLALQRMLPRRTGHIINTASLAGSSRYLAWRPTALPSSQSSDSQRPHDWSTASQGFDCPQSGRRSPTPNSSPEPPAQRDYATPSRRRSPARQRI